MVLTSKPLRSTLTKQDAETLAKVIVLLNGTPRHAPRDRRLHFDSYSLAGDLTHLLERSGYQWQMLYSNLDRD
jgi:hypothetical protein